MHRNGGSMFAVTNHFKRRRWKHMNNPDNQPQNEPGGEAVPFVACGELSDQWYCLHTKPRREQQAFAYCRQQLSLTAYFPRLQEYRSIRRVRRLVTSPLFPRYFFCRLPLTAYRSVKFAPDVLDIVHVGDRPAVVPTHLIEELQAWAGDVLDATLVRCDIRTGDLVQIVDGPLCGLPGTILRAKDDQDRVGILLSLLQHGAQTYLSRTQLRRAQ
jgi:transcription antitermination factor NusG